MVLSKCQTVIHEVEFYLTDLGTQIKEAIVKFDADLDARTCKNCGTVNSSRRD